MDARILTGLLRPVVAGVYVVSILDGERARLAAAQLALEHAVASHRSAAALHGLLTAPRSDPEVLVPRGGTTRLHGVVVRETRHLPVEDRTTVDGIRATTVERTLLDLVRTRNPSWVRTTFEAALANGVADPTRLLASHHGLARRGRSGTAARRLLLDDLLGSSGPLPRSVLEFRVRSLLTKFEVDGFVGQYRPPWYRNGRGIVDFAHPDARVILEADGRAWHATSEKMAEDRRRDRSAASAGWLVLRVTWHEVVDRPAQIATEIHRILERRLDALGVPFRASG